MIKNFSKGLGLSLIFFFFFAFLSSHFSYGISLQDCEQKVGTGELSLPDLNECDTRFNDVLKGVSTQRRSLEQEVKRFNTAIIITTTRILTTIKEIENLEKEIASLSAKIGQLDLSLDEVSEILAKRIQQTYKKGRLDSVSLFLSSQNFTDFLSRFKYLKVTQLHDRKLMIQMETARTTFEDQKTLKEKKQEELETAQKKLESQKTLLTQQKVDKDRLLKETQSNEARYQNLLASSRAEIEAIQGIIAGQGQETEAGKISQGQRIATVISGASACSTGTHLHFQVAEGNAVKNPFDYLRNIGMEDNSGGDPHDGRGSWDWPLNEPIKFNQGFGANTSAIRAGFLWYNFHTGIDISSSDRVVKAVKSGALYQGAIACGNGTLRYVRVDHDDSNLDTYYLHVNY
jgi:peptidoglycan hydrolase CwlO-like protein